MPGLTRRWNLASDVPCLEPWTAGVHLQAVAAPIPSAPDVNREVRRKGGLAFARTAHPTRGLALCQDVPDDPRFVDIDRDAVEGNERKTALRLAAATLGEGSRMLLQRPSTDFVEQPCGVLRIEAGRRHTSALSAKAGARVARTAGSGTETVKGKERPAGRS
jgi:hypothetical protein